jgi:copper chaperone CopZ
VVSFYQRKREQSFQRGNFRGGRKMKLRFFMIISLISFTVIGLLPYLDGITGSSTFPRSSNKGAAYAQETEISKVVFKVKCYDEGKAALQGLNGIKKIETGFHYIHETDTVYFDPAKITIEEMEAALKKAGTYVDTIQPKERN